MISRVLALVAVLVPSLALGAVRSFTDHEGNTIRAEFTGVKEGQVVLREKATRRQYPLSSFSLEDRDFIVESLRAKKQDLLLQELMTYEVRNANRPAGSTVPDGPGAGLDIPGAGIPPAENVEAQARASLEIDSDEPKQRYGLTVPTEELIGEPQPRRWTDLRGQQLVASYVKIDESVVVVLQETSGAQQRVPLVNLTTEDIEFIKSAHEADLSVPVFPAGQFAEPTAEDLAKGIRVWTDRRGEKLAGKYIRRDGRITVLEVAGAEQQYPTVGLSTADRQWIDQEERRRAEEIRRQQEEARQRAAAAANSSGSNFGPGGGFGPRGGSMMRQYEFHCSHCNNRWTDSSPFSQCANCRDRYEFVCHRCGHRWTKQGQMLDHCPNCSQQRANQTAGGYSPGGNGYSPAGYTPSSAGTVSSEGTPSGGGWSRGQRRLVGKLIGLAIFSVLGLAGWGFSKNRQ